MRRSPGPLLAAVLVLAGCSTTVAGTATPPDADTAAVSLAGVAGADADVLGVARADDRAVVLLAPPGGPLTLADVAADGTARPVPLTDLDPARTDLTRITPGAVGRVVVVGVADGQVAAVVANEAGTSGALPVEGLAAADVADLEVVADTYGDVLHLAVTGTDGASRLLTVDTFTGAVRTEVPLPGPARGLSADDDGDLVAVSTDAGGAAAVTTPAGTVPLGQGSAGPLTVADGEVYATVGGTGEVSVVRGDEVLATVPGDFPAALAVDLFDDTATLVDTPGDGEVPRVVVRTVDLAGGGVLAEVELCDSGSVAGADVGPGGGVVVSDCRGEPTLWRLP